MKVTGRLRYSGDQPIENVAYGYLVTSTIARGQIGAMDVSETEKSPGVVAVYTPFHSLKLYEAKIIFSSGSMCFTVTLIMDLIMLLVRGKPGCVARSRLDGSAASSSIQLSSRQFPGLPEEDVFGQR